MENDVKVLEQSQLFSKIAVTVGTRPGIVMFAPIIHEMERRGLAFFVIHTGQHYSPNMDGQFFKDLGLPKPEFKIKETHQNKTHGAQTAVMLAGIESILLKEKPRLVLVGGDANTNLAAALAARKLGIEVGHVEAGERSFDWRMPEEHNRRIIDHISEHLFVSNEKGCRHLQNESVQGKTYIAGNPIVDASLQHAAIAKEHSDILTRYRLGKRTYALLTMHREENVDSSPVLENILTGVAMASRKLDLPVIFPVHPRTVKRLEQFGMTDWAHSLEKIRMIDAAGYLDFLQLLCNSKIVFTDSGGVQQEACIHHVPAVTLRDNTEWTETLDIGANRLAGSNPENISKAAVDAAHGNKPWQTPFGDGQSASRIVELCERIIQKNESI